MVVDVKVTCKPDTKDYQRFNHVLSQIFEAGKRNEEQDFLNDAAKEVHGLMDILCQQAFEEGKRFAAKDAQRITEARPHPRRIKVRRSPASLQVPG